MSNFLIFTSFTTLFPVLPLHLNNLGATNVQIGMVMGAFPVGVLMFRLLVSWMIAKKGRRWTMVFGALAMALTSNLYLLVAEVFLLMLVRFVHGFGLAAFTTASIVYVADITTLENRGQMMGYLGAANFLGFGVGPYIASVLYRTFNILPVFLSAVIFAFLATFIIYFIRDHPESNDANERKTRFYQVINHRWFIIPTSFVFMMALVQGTIITFLPIFLRHKGNMDPGIFFLFFSFAVLFVRIIAGKVADQQGRGIVIVVSAIVAMSGLFVLWHIDSLLALILAAVLYGSGYGSQQPTMAALVADNTTYLTRSAIFSVYWGMFDIGIMLSGYIFGIIADSLSVDYIYPIAMTFYFLGLCIFITLNQKTILY